MRGSLHCMVSFIIGLYITKRPCQVAWLSPCQVAWLSPCQIFKPYSCTKNRKYQHTYANCKQCKNGPEIKQLHVLALTQHRLAWLYQLYCISRHNSKWVRNGLDHIAHQLLNGMTFKDTCFLLDSQCLILLSNCNWFVSMTAILGIYSFRQRRFGSAGLAIV